MISGPQNQPGDTTDEAAFSAFYRQFAPTLVAFLGWQGARLPEAADIAQDTMIKAYQRWSEIYQPESWARKVASRELVRRIASVKKQDLVEEIPERSLLPPQLTNVTAWEQQDEILRILDLLPSRQRQAMALRLDGYTPSEIADELKTTDQAIRSILKRARRTLAQRVVSGDPVDQLEQLDRVVETFHHVNRALPKTVLDREELIALGGLLTRISGALLTLTDLLSAPTHHYDRTRLLRADTDAPRAHRPPGATGLLRDCREGYLAAYTSARAFHADLRRGDGSSQGAGDAQLTTAMTAGISGHRRRTAVSVSVTGSDTVEQLDRVVETFHHVNRALPKTVLDREELIALGGLLTRISGALLTLTDLLSAPTHHYDRTRLLRADTDAPRAHRPPGATGLLRDCREGYLAAYTSARAFHADLRRGVRTGAHPRSNRGGTQRKHALDHQETPPTNAERQAGT